MGEFVRLEVSDAVATLRLDRPPMNALSREVQEQLRAAAREATERSDVRAVVLYGGEKLFAAGADVKEMAGWDYAEALRQVGDLQGAFTAVARIPKPVVAAVTGYALGGGCELALCADFRIAAQNARFGQPEIALGLIPGAGGTQRLARLIGPARAKQMCFSGRHVRAEEALAIGLADKVVAAEQVHAEAVAFVTPFVTGPRIALAAAKQAIDAGLEVDLDTGLGIERQHFAALFATPDAATGMASFLTDGPGKATFSAG